MPLIKAALGVLLAAAAALGGAGVSATGEPGGGAAAAGVSVRWHWPTSPPGAVVRAFLAPPGPYAAGHRGIDVAASAGQAVLSPTDAVVSFSGVVVDRPVITLRVDEHVLVSMEPVASELPVGAAVAAGTVIGAIAGGGHCDGGCLHIGVRVDGEYVSPLLFLAGVPPAVLLPLE